jgi:predicted negative regulator of RcsB-dependent stress response
VSVFRHIVNTEAEIALRQTNYTLARALNMSLTTPENTQTGFSHQETSEGYALINIAYIDIATGSHASAGKTLNFARALFTAHGSRFGLLACDITLGDLHCKLGEYNEARRLYAQSYASVNDMELRTMCIEKLSDVALVQQEITSAQRYSTLLLVLSSRSGHQAHIHHALRRLGDVFLAQGDETNALLVFEVALAGYTLMDIHRCRGECLLRIGDIQAARADTVAARVSWVSARPEFEKSLQHNGVAQCDQRLVALPSNHRNLVLE